MSDCYLVILLCLAMLLGVVGKAVLAYIYLIKQYLIGLC